MSENRQLPSHMVQKEFGEVNVRPAGPGQIEVLFTISMAPQGQEAEGWQTGVALDASQSMWEAFGQVWNTLVPTAELQRYMRQGLVKERTQDGQRFLFWEDKAREDAIKRGYLKKSENIVQPKAREFISYLADNLDEDGGTTLIYWACGDGSAFEVVGDFTADQCRNLVIEGPKSVSFGTGTILTPAVRYFVDRFKEAKRGMYLFITDGKIDDLESVKTYTRYLAREIAAGRRNFVKCVLIGIGDEIDESQMEQLDDLDTGTDVDIWDHKIAKDMRDLVEIFAEVVSENTIVAPSALIMDSTNRVVAAFSDGLPAKVTFQMPASSSWFELEVGGMRIRQSVR